MLSKEALARVKRIEIGTRRKVGTLFAGNYSSLFRGQGMTFSEVRPYQPGDDVRRIDWNVSARSREVYVKQFIEERELTICILVDVSASQRFGSRGGDKLRLAAELSALFAFAAIKHNDRVAMVAFSDRIEQFVPPKKGRKHVLRLINDILEIQPQGHGTDWVQALELTERVLHRRSVVVFVSDFVGLTADTNLRTFGRRHDVIPVWLTDPMEKQLPDVGLLWAIDPETRLQRWFDSSSRAVREAYAKSVEREHQRVSLVMRQAGMDPVRIQNGSDYTRELLSYFKKRSRLK